MNLKEILKLEELPMGPESRLTPGFQRVDHFSGSAVPATIKNRGRVTYADGGRRQAYPSGLGE
jgi:hypothetical protein